ncbi:hypothetical protein GCM10027346_01670 [Hymenobacter seoulensis]
MKTASKVILTVLGLLLVSGVFGYAYIKKRFEPAPNQLVLSGQPITSSFVWLADSSARPVMPHAALLVPVTVPGCSRTCYLQFDTGAPSSLLYAKSLAALRTSFPATGTTLLPQADTLRNFQFGLGNGQVQARWMRVLNYGTSQVPADSTTPFILGTLGADVLDGHVLVLDYARQQFCIAASLADSLRNSAVFVPLKFESRRVMLEAGVQNQTKPLLFDSGSSAFSLLTSETNWKELAQPAAKVRIASVNNLGKKLTSYTVPTAVALQFGATALPLGTVTYIEGTSLMESTLMRFSGMGGMLGNEIFRNHTIILDAPGGRFGVVQR